jgi:hypothetical protein
MLRETRVSIKATCDDCGRTYAVPDGSAGKRAKCRACGHVFVVPAAAASDRPSVRALAAQPAGEPDENRHEDDDGDDWFKLHAAVAELDTRVAGEAARPAAVEPGVGRTPAGAGGLAWDVLGMVCAPIRWLNGEDRLFAGVVLLELAALPFARSASPPPPETFLLGCVILAVLYLVGGFVIVTARSARTGTSVRLAWNTRAVLLSLALGVVGYLIFQRVILRVRGDRASGGLLNLLLLVGKSIAIALLGVWIGVVADQSAHATPRAPTALEQRVNAMGPVQPNAPLRYLTQDVPAPNPTPPAPQPADAQAAPSAADASRQTTRNLLDLFRAEIIYQNRHHLAAPASIDDMAADRRGGRVPASPFDPTSAEPGYVLLPGNVSAPPFRVVFYDAAELRLTGRTHVIYHPGRRVAVLSRDQLAAEPGVALP